MASLITHLGNGMQVLSEIADELSSVQDVAVGKWFGKPCLKVGRKVFATLWGDDMAFKLTGEAHAEALRVEGAHLFDPRGQGHPMKEWVQIPAARSLTWGRFARLACEYVAGAAQAEKDAIIRGLIEARQKILDAARSLSPAEQDEVFLGVWSVKDLLAHLAGWDYTNLRAVEEILAGQKPSFWEQYDPNWKSYNARLVAEYKREDFDELVAVVQESHRKLIDYLQAIPADEYLKRRSIASLLRTEAKDEEKHHGQVEAFRERLAEERVQ
jgi:uncharacterized damage-inducible protein DinB